MSLLFVDTWGWLALWDKKDSSHNKVKNYYQEFRKQKGIVVTTDYVLDETITLIFRRTHFNEAKNYIETINESIDYGYINCESISPSRFQKALELRFRFQDKPKISFTDLTSFVIMEEFSIKDVMTNDRHFVQVNLGFKKNP